MKNWASLLWFHPKPNSTKNVDCQGLFKPLDDLSSSCLVSLPQFPFLAHRYQQKHNGALSSLLINSKTRIFIPLPALFIMLGRNYWQTLTGCGFFTVRILFPWSLWMTTQMLDYWPAETFIPTFDKIIWYCLVSLNSFVCICSFVLSLDDFWGRTMGFVQTS